MSIVVKVTTAWQIMLKKHTQKLKGFSIKSQVAGERM